MGNTIGSFFSGVSQVFGKIFGHPIDFLSGKSCNSACGPTWDVECYIENFCIANLLKLALVAVLVYFVLLFLYLVYNLGICQCICHIMCRSIWACCATYFSALNCCCTYLCHTLRSVKRRRPRRRKKDIEAALSSTSSEQEGYELGEISNLQQRRNLKRGRSLYNRSMSYKDERLRRSLKPTSHRTHVEFSKDTNRLSRKKTLKHIGDHTSPLHHHVRVARSSRFSHKRSRHRGGIQQRRR